MIKVLYKPVSMLTSVFAGMLAGALFDRTWKLFSGGEDVPEATDARRAWPEVLAAALQGAVFAVAKAAADRATAESTRKLTGIWPGRGGDTERAVG